MAFEFCLVVAGVYFEVFPSWTVFFAGVVSESQSQVEEEGEVLGPQHCHGGVWLVRSHGEAFHPFA